MTPTAQQIADMARALHERRIPPSVCAKCGVRFYTLIVDSGVPLGPPTMCDECAPRRWKGRRTVREGCWAETD